MKILTVVCNLEKGGTQRAAQNFCEGYYELGADSKILAVSGGGIRVKELREKNIDIWLDFNENTLSEIKRWFPDVIHIHSHRIEESIIYKIKELLPTAKFIETNVFSIPSNYAHIIDYSYQLSSWCEYLYASRGGKISKSLVLPNPVKTKNFYKSTEMEIINFKQKYNIPNNNFIFGRIGQHFYGKWSLYLIDLFKRFVNNVNNKCILLLINPPKEIFDHIKVNKIKEKVVIINQITNDNELRNCYSAIDVFLHIANKGESFGMVLAESLLCKTPVISLNTPWGDNSQNEIIGKGGKCVNTIDEFYKEMIYLYKNKRLRDNLGTNGRIQIINNYDYLKLSKNSIDIVNNNFNKSKLSKNNIFKFYKIDGLKDLIALLLIWIKFNIRIRNSHKYINYLLRKLYNFELKKGYFI